MKTITVCKADPIIASQPVEAIELRIADKLPEMTDWFEDGWQERLANFYEAQALLIMEALNSLPGATRYHLLALLLEEKASLLRVKGF